MWLEEWRDPPPPTPYHSAYSLRLSLQPPTTSVYIENRVADPYVFGPPGSFYHIAKTVRKTLILVISL
jgi:hypothetical protein